MTSPSDSTNIDPTQGDAAQPTVPAAPFVAGPEGVSATPNQPVAPEQPVAPQQPLAPAQPVIQAPPGYVPPASHQATYAQPQSPNNSDQQATAQHPTLTQPSLQESSAFGMAAAPAAAPKTGGRGMGMLVAGLAIGALLGGIVGGGTAALVGANQNNAPASSGTGTVTIANPNSVTEVTAVAARAMPSVVTLEVNSAAASGTGSGVIISKDGYILSNAHVVTVDGSATDPTVRVQLSDGRLLQAEVVGVDPYADLAVVKVDASDLPAIEWGDSSELNVGDLTVAIGAPLNLADTVTSGVVSALNRGISVGSPLVPQDQGQQQEETPENPWDFRFDVPNSEESTQTTGGGQVTLGVIQTDASINPGNSGGALLNSKGELIGINVAIASPSSSTGVAGSAGLGFAIPSNFAKRISDAIIAGETPTHGLLGTTVTDAESDPAATVAGALLGEIIPGGAAEQAGLRSGDIVTSVDGVAIDDGTSLSALVRSHAGGSKITLGYVRDGVTSETTVTLGTL